MTADGIEYRDSRLTYGAFKALEVVGHLVGHHRARAVAARVWRGRARSSAAFSKLAHRISPRLRANNPRLFKVPVDWTARSPVVSVERLGLGLDLDLRDNLQALLFFAGTYEPDVLAFLERELGQGDTFVDVGAHIGLHSLVAAACLEARGGGRVIAFEPTSDSAQKIRTAAARNRLAVEVVQAALGAVPGEAPILADGNYDEHDAGVRSQFGDGAEVERVRVIAFDDWAGANGLERMDVVKVDVEGAEPLVLAGMRRTLASLRPRALVIEVKDYSFERAGTDAALLEGVLTELGYRDDGVELNRNRLYRPVG